MSLADKLANATGSTRSAVMAQTKGKGKKKAKKGKQEEVVNVDIFEGKTVSEYKKIAN